MFVLAFSLFLLFLLYILQFQQLLQTTFSQPSLRIDIHIRAQEERPQLLTQRQQFDKMCEENEALQKLNQEFALDIE